MNTHSVLIQIHLVEAMDTFPQLHVVDEIMEYINILYTFFSDHLSFYRDYIISADLIRLRSLYLHGPTTVALPRCAEIHIPISTAARISSHFLHPGVHVFLEGSDLLLVA